MNLLDAGYTLLYFNNLNTGQWLIAAS